jgi:hypothetical protein
METVPVVVLLRPKTADGTTLWANRKVMSLFLEHGGEIGVPPLGRLEEKAQYFCNGNFKLFMPAAVKLEFGKTYGVHIDQYRIAGFFDEGYQNFIALDWFIKKTQRNDRRMNAVYERVDAIREARSWIKK